MKSGSPRWASGIATGAAADEGRFAALLALPLALPLLLLLLLLQLLTATAARSCSSAGAAVRHMLAGWLLAGSTREVHGGRRKGRGLGVAGRPPPPACSQLVHVSMCWSPSAIDLWIYLRSLECSI